MPKLWHIQLILEPQRATTKQVLDSRNPGGSLTLDQLSPEPPRTPEETSTMSQTGGRFHNKKAGIRAAVILIGLLHKSRKAKEKEREKEREKEESEGWVKFVPSCRLMTRAGQAFMVWFRGRQTVCSAGMSCDCGEIS